VPTFILATVGTSLLNRVRGGDKSALPAVVEAVSYLAKREWNDPACGAEINSTGYLMFKRPRLSIGRPEPPYSLHFLVSDTDEGEWTGKVLCKYYERLGREVRDVSTERIPGLTPEDPDEFAREGLRNLVKLAAGEIRNHQGMTKIINATGGFKAQISFAGLIGQTLGVPVVYRFETFEHCIEMPPMPVDFNRELWLQNLDLFRRLSEEVMLAEDQFPFDEVNGKIKSLLDQMVDGGKTYYALSPILELMHQGFLMRWPPEVREPLPAGVAPRDKLKLTRKELSHSPRGTEDIAGKIAGISWVREVRSVEFMNTPRSHLLPPDPGDPSTVYLVYSDGDLGVKLAVRTTAATEGEVMFVRYNLGNLI